MVVCIFSPLLIGPNRPTRSDNQHHIADIRHNIHQYSIVLQLPTKMTNEYGVNLDDIDNISLNATSIDLIVRSYRKRVAGYTLSRNALQEKNLNGWRPIHQ